MKDFIGQEITPGCFVAYPGGGNAKAEYGLILYRITAIDSEKKKFKAQRLDVVAGFIREDAQWAKSVTKRRNVIDDKTIYPSHGTPYKWMITMIESTLENPNKLVVVQAPAIAYELFDAIYDQDTSILEKISAAEVSAWIHGSVHAVNPFRK